MADSATPGTTTGHAAHHDLRVQPVPLIAREPLPITATRRLLPFIVVAAIVAWQTVRAAGAWFYTDDWLYFVPPGSVFDLFSLYNGHWLPVFHAVFAVLMAAVGPNHFAVFLAAAAACNIALGMAVVWWLSSRVGAPLQALIAASVLVVPYSDHTVFWLGAAMNLLPLAALVFWLGAVERDCGWARAALIGGLLVSVGLGGYGLIVLTGFVVATFLRRKVGDLALALLALVVALVPQALGQLEATGSASIARAPLLQWLNASLADTVASLSLVPTLLTVGLVVGLVAAGPRRGERAEYLRRKLTSPATSAFVTCMAAFVMLVYLTRGGVELLSASRYILLVVALSTLAVVSWFTEPRASSGESSGTKPKGLFVAAVLAVLVIVRVPGWQQAASNASYGGTANRDAVVELICSGVDDADLAQRVASRDGLGTLNAAITTSAWADFRRATESRCGAGQTND